LDSGEIALQMAHLSKKYAKNVGSFVSTKSRADFDNVDFSVGDVTIKAKQDKAKTKDIVRTMSKGKTPSGSRAPVGRAN